MRVPRSGLDFLNRLLSRSSLRLETRTSENAETVRLLALRENGHFVRSVFPVPRSFEAFDADTVLEPVSRYASRFDDFVDPSLNDVGYSFANGYFTSPDTEVLYTILQEYHPRRVVEVGSGYSTQIIRQAVLDGKFPCEIVSIDPKPRRDVKQLVDTLHAVPVEVLGQRDLFPRLESGDVLFIDSSHLIKAGNDVTYLYLYLIPQLVPGVLIHVHDIFLPYDYPEDWVVGRRYGWNEQYLVQALLMCEHRFDVLWPGRFVQGTRSDFGRHFSHLHGRGAQSLWLRTKH